MKKQINGERYVWSDVAVDYSGGVDIFDPVTGIVYTHGEAIQEKQDVKSRLTLRPKKTGAWVRCVKINGKWI